MNEKLRTILRNAWTEPRHFFFWLALFSLLAFCALGFVDMQFPGFAPSPRARTLAAMVLVFLAIVFVISVFGFVFSWIPPVRRLLSRILRRRSFVLACVATVVALFYAEENWRGKLAWEKFRREQTARGDPFDMKGMAPPAVPDSQNFALAPIVATTYSGYLSPDGRRRDPIDTNVVNRLAMPLDIEVRGVEWPGKQGTGNWLKGKKTDLAEWQSYFARVAARTNVFPVPDHPQSPGAAVLVTLSKYDGAIEELRQAARRPESRFPLEYDTDCPAAILLPHLARLKACMPALQLRAVAELDTGQGQKALEDVKLMLRVSESLRQEPLLISHLVRIAMASTALQPVWEGLTDHQWSDAQLAALEQDLGRLDFLAAYRRAIRGEQACWSGDIDYLRRTRQFNMLSTDESSGSMVPPPIAWLIPSGWFYQNEARGSRIFVRVYLPLADPAQRVVKPGLVREAEAAVARKTHFVGPYNWLEKFFLLPAGVVVKRFAVTQSEVDQARVACALERFRLAQGQYPETLDALVPRCIDKLPHDLINGQPLHYRRTDDGRFVLYSVGWNEVDDAGKVALRKDGKPNPDEGDWVWPD